MVPLVLATAACAAAETAGSRGRKSSTAVNTITIMRSRILPARDALLEARAVLDGRMSLGDVDIVAKDMKDMR